MTEKSRSVLKLSNGREFVGQSIGAPLSSSGELVFTTAMVGYTESISDPSYFGQMLVFSYPLIGNYGVPKPEISSDGISPKGLESPGIFASGVILSSISHSPSHWSSNSSLHEWLLLNGVPGIVGIDTRSLVQEICNTANLFAKLIPVNSEGETVFSESANSDGYFDPGASLVLPSVSTPTRKTIGGGKFKIALLDCGVKSNIVRLILDKGISVELIPWDQDLQEVECDGWVISNGPGDPVNTGDLVDRIKRLLQGDVPILGICLGHQLLSLAAGAETKKMPFGHRSHNQPVQLVGSPRGYITSQNHGYEVDRDSLPPEWQPWFVNANDGSIEGIRHVSKPYFGVQFHPEAAAGPRDTTWIFDDFLRKIYEN